ncbi:hypothetical protein EK0264_17155 [Epidermidibacterium keratini]|uniref:Uncharacterized protein n=1 Tax=Epidermidibacterium keratini TaxID=1891644 RepID=A0A7L4YRQ7_9ACTN|nr:hypothetical protein [Epidermidibacterium keratini]QHC01836.1 hypothetical protein EK0264_17155 [Epidermidibacterium keratini]
MTGEPRPVARYRIETGIGAVPAWAFGLVTAVSMLGLVMINKSGLAAPLSGLPVAVLLIIFLVLLLRQRRGRGHGVGVDVTDTVVRLGRFPNEVVEIPRDQVASAVVSTTPFRQQASPPPTRTFVLFNWHYLTLTTRSGEVYRVAFEQSADGSDPSPGAQQVGRLLGAVDEHAPVADPSRDAQLGAAKPAPPDEHAAERLWVTAFARHDEVLAAYAPYEMDPVTALTYPAISDVSVPETASFFEALAEASALRPEDPRHAGAIFDEYRAAVRRLTQAWRSAERRARQVGTDLLADDDARRLRQATKLLGHAERAATAAERASYLRSARELIERLTHNGAITAPPRVIEQIESTTALAIEAAQQDGQRE